MGKEAPTVVISGASAGIGRAAATEFARAGYRVGLIGRSEQGLAECCADLARTGAIALALPADVADAAEIDRAAARAEAQLGPIDVWVNSAMATVFSPVGKLSAAEVRRVTEVTYLGCVHGTMAALRRMQPRNRGTIVQVGSALAYRSIPLQSAYCGAKFAIRGFTDSLRSELIHDGSEIRLTMVQLPAHNTPQFDWARNKLGKRVQPVPPIYQPEAAARAIMRAAREAPRELWVGRATFQAILGNMLLPGLLDRLMAVRAYDGQMTDVDEAPGRADNLERPVDGLHHAHGRFDDRARPRALAMSSQTARLLVLMVGISVAAVFGAAAIGIVGWLMG